jgi:hypothetical protein
MSNVVQGNFGGEPEQISGTAMCLACRHEWVAVAPTGAPTLQCPSCNTFRGVYKHPISAANGEEVASCRCGGNIFQLTRRGPLCLTCGTRMDW